MASRRKKTAKRTAPARNRSRSGSGSIGFAIGGALFSILAYVIFGTDGQLFRDIMQLPEQPTPVALPGESPAGADRLVGSSSVIDADTLEIRGQRVRFNAVDAPESGQRCLDSSGKLVRCGQIAANALDSFIAGNPVSCAISGKDRYDRALGGCSVRNVDLQDWLVRNGHALAYRQYSTDYVAAEEEAQRMRAGIWAGDFVEPWNWRKGDRLPVERAAKASFTPE